MWMRRLAAGLVLLVVPGLTGCFSSVRRVQKVQQQAPGSFKSADTSALERLLADRAAAIRTLNASVLATATTGGEKTGKEKTYSSFRGYLFVRRPHDVRMLLQLPVIGSRAMDMVSDGTNFTLLIPPKSLAYVGRDEVTKPSNNGLENLRPVVILDSVLVPAVKDDEFVVVTESTRLVQAARAHHPAIEEPDYDLQVLQVKSGNMLALVRVVHISRLTLLPVQQDVYDHEGEIMTQAVYEDYGPTEAGQFPKTITIRRPQDQFSLRLDVTKLVLNGNFESDQFEMPKIPASFKVKHIE